MRETAGILRLPPGELAPTYIPGSFGVVRDWKEDTVGELIQAGERARFGRTAWSNLTHSFGIVGANGDIVEANEPGVERKNIAKYRDADVFVVHVVASEEQRALCVEFWEAQVGAKYDVLDFVGLAAQAIFGWQLSLHSDKRFICSGLVARGTEKYVAAYPRSAETMMPADLASYWGLDMHEDPVPLSFFARFLDKVRAIGRFVAGLVSRPFR